MEKIKVLFFAAEPIGGSRLMIDEEIRAITKKIRSAEYRDSIELVPALAARPGDLIQMLNEHKPQIVHFSSHGKPTGELLLLDQDGSFPKRVKPNAIRALFETLKDNIRVVLLNACYSKIQARAIVEVIDCAIGIKNPISNQAAITFAASFYRAVGFGRSVKEAFDQGRAALMLEGIDKKNIPELLIKEGVDPSSIFVLKTTPKALEKIYEEFWGSEDKSQKNRERKGTSIQPSIKLKWKYELGNGIIDCSISKNNKIVAGDVNGSVAVLDIDGNILSKSQYKMPVWGVDINKNGDIVAVGLACKDPFSGEFLVSKKGKIIFRKVLKSPVWDVRISNESMMAFASTWEDGLLSFNLKSKKFNNIKSNNTLFGISLLNDEKLLVTSSGEGIYYYDIKREKISEQIILNETCCYKNIFDKKRNCLFCGSSSNILSMFDLNKSIEIQYKTILSQICGMAVIGDYLMYGDLLGKFFISKASIPNIPLFLKEFNEGIWSIAVDESNENIIIACGDGNLYCYKLHLEEKSYDFFSVEDISSNILSLLEGVKIFISYAREDLTVAEILYKSLKNLGCNPWLDIYNVLPGQDWKRQTKMAIQKSDFIIACLSKKSLSKKGYVQKELKEALEEFEKMPENKVFLLPLRLDDCQVPESLARWHWVDLHSGDGFNKLITSIYLERLRSL